ncbi:hypothetical protein NUSPORA_00893 [Nucleospora cyclopteri]
MRKVILISRKRIDLLFILNQIINGLFISQLKFVLMTDTNFLQLNPKLEVINEKLKLFNKDTLEPPDIDDLETVKENLGIKLMEMSFFLRDYIEENTDTDEFFIEFTQTTLDPTKYNIEEIARNCANEDEYKKKTQIEKNKMFKDKIIELYESIRDELCLFIYDHIYKSILLEIFNYDYIIQRKIVHSNILGTYISPKQKITSEYTMLFYLENFRTHLFQKYSYIDPVLIQVSNQISTLKMIGKHFDTTIISSLSTKYDIKEKCTDIDLEEGLPPQKKIKLEKQETHSLHKLSFLQNIENLSDSKILEFYLTCPIVNYSSYGNCGLFAFCISILSSKSCKKKLIARIVGANDTDKVFALSKFIFLSIIANKIDYKCLNWTTMLYISHFLRCCLKNAALSDENWSLICDFDVLKRFYNRHTSYTIFHDKFKPMAKIEGQFAKEIFGVCLFSNCYFLTIEELTLLSKYLNIKMHIVIRLPGNKFNIMKFENCDSNSMIVVLYLDSISQHYMPILVDN